MVSQLAGHANVCILQRLQIFSLIHSLHVSSCVFGIWNAKQRTLWDTEYCAKCTLLHQVENSKANYDWTISVWGKGVLNGEINIGVLIFQLVCPPCCRFSNHASLQEILNELNDYAGQRELIAENMITSICVELTKYLQDLKQERKTVREGGRESEAWQIAEWRGTLCHLKSLPSPAPGWCQEGPAEFREQL